MTMISVNNRESVSIRKRIEIRSARLDDASFLARIILIAGRAHVRKGIWEVVLGGTEEECLAFLETLAVTRIPHLFHYSCYLVGEVGGSPAAALGGYDPQLVGYQALKAAIPEVVEKLWLTGVDPEGEEHSARVLGCVPELIEGAWVIDSVATFPEFRRQGIASMLLEEILGEGRKQGFRQAQINMYIGNTAAQRAYEKHGFRVLEIRRDPNFEMEMGCPGMMSLVREL
jgi:ribosomal protein S18 acetylase RimI-like enzyme